MNTPIFTENWSDSNNNPAGGVVFGPGFTISWQNGPLGRGSERKEPNGAFVENIIKAAATRIEYYQNSKFACEENAQALDHLNAALWILNNRTKDREARQVEGTHKE